MVPLKNSASPDRVAAIDGQRDARDGAGGIAGEKEDGRGDFIGPCHALHRRETHPDREPLRISKTGVRHWRIDICRRHTVHSHTAFRPFARQRLREVMYPRLRHIVMSLPLRVVRDEARDRAERYDRAATPIKHGFGKLSAAPECAIEVDLQNLPPRLVGYAFTRSIRLGDAGIRNENVN